MSVIAAQCPGDPEGAGGETAKIFDDVGAKFYSLLSLTDLGIDN